MLYPYLSDDHGILPSVHLLGNLGIEKNEVICRTCVGVVNPTGKSETFGISALDFNAFGIPVVGNVPVIETGLNGYRTHFGFTFYNRVIELLSDEAKRKSISDSSKSIVEKYYPERIIPLWMELIDFTIK